MVVTEPTKLPRFRAVEAHDWIVVESVGVPLQNTVRVSDRRWRIGLSNNVVCRYRRWVLTISPD
jgi:hypothetical protein